MQSHLAALNQTVQVYGASDHYPNKRGISDYLDGSLVMNEVKRHAMDNNDPFYNATRDPLGSVGIHDQEHTEDQEPKVTTHFPIRQDGNASSLSKHDIFFIRSNQFEHDLERLEYPGVSVNGPKNDIITPVIACNIAEVNKDLRDHQIDYLKKTVPNYKPDGKTFLMHELGGITPWVRHWIYHGAVYNEINAQGGDSEYADWNNKPVVKMKYITALHQGLHMIHDGWGGPLPIGTRLYLVLKPTAVAEIPGGNKLHVIYQWTHVATPNSDISVIRDLTYMADNVPGGFGGLTMVKYEFVSAAFVHVATMKANALKWDTVWDADQLSNTYAMIRNRRLLEVDIKFHTRPKIISGY